MTNDDSINTFMFNFITIKLAYLLLYKHLKNNMYIIIVIPNNCFSQGFYLK